ncbi:JAB domain-containing protein [Algoriphagus sp.]|uniref:JAB domain-containing protein n=1 Tax=Algoriphagus sp. TaxID=1872435 RepID=UPI00261B2E2D|nr:JAB domain-containing protein [Algoriphagus sp.]
MTNTVNEIQLSYKPNRDFTENYKITSSRDAFLLLERVFNPDTICLREEFVIIYLNRANRVLGYYKAFTGGLASVVCDTKLILAVALKSMASGIILAHNHPSGSLEPSEQDKSLTRRVKAACQNLDVELLDHLILGADGGYFSFSDESLI